MQTKTEIKPRKFTIQLTLQELDTIEAYLLKPSDKKPWLEMALMLDKRASSWRKVLKKENGGE
jgi:hypothetical protein